MSIFGPISDNGVRLGFVSFEWKAVKDSLSVRFVLEWAYEGHTFVVAETRLLSESAWQSIDDVARTMRYRLIGTLTGIINRMVEDGEIQNK